MVLLSSSSLSNSIGLLHPEDEDIKSLQNIRNIYQSTRRAKRLETSGLNLLSMLNFI
jgi:hypothetical protein